MNGSYLRHFLGDLTSESPKVFVQVKGRLLPVSDIEDRGDTVVLITDESDAAKHPQ